MNRTKLAGFIVLFIILGGMFIAQRFFLPKGEEWATAEQKISASFLEKELSQLEPGDIVQLPDKQIKMVDYVIEGKFILFKGLDGPRHEIEKLARSETRIIKKCTTEYCQVVQFVSFL